MYFVLGSKKVLSSFLYIIFGTLFLHLHTTATDVTARYQGENNVYECIGAGNRDGGDPDNYACGNVLNSTGYL